MSLEFGLHQSNRRKAEREQKSAGYLAKKLETAEQERKKHQQAADQAETDAEEKGHAYVDSLVAAWPSDLKNKVPGRADRTAAERLRITRIFSGAAQAQMKQNAEAKRSESVAPRLEKLAAGQAPEGELERRLGMTSSSTGPRDHRTFGSS